MTEAFRSEAGGVRLELSGWQAEILGAVPVLAMAGNRALPVNAYEDDVANAEFRRLMDHDAERADAADVALVTATLEGAAEGVVLNHLEAEAWLRTVGKARLVLADRLGIASNAWESDTASTDPELELLHYLSWVQSSLIDALSDTLPDLPDRQ